MQTVNEIILTEDNRVMLETRTRVEKVITSDTFRPLLDSFQLKLKSFHDLRHLPGFTVAHLCSSLKEHVWTVPIKTLTIRAPFAMLEGGLVPSFGSKNDPLLKLEWPVPPSLNLNLVISTVADGGEWCCAKEWLLAFDENSAAWRLPLANLYEDASLCSGDWERTNPTSTGLLGVAIHQFVNSQWNQDLHDTGDMKKVQALIRFDPKTEPYTALPVNTPDWRNLTRKVGSPIIESVVL